MGPLDYVSAGGAVHAQSLYIPNTGSLTCYKRTEGTDVRFVINILNNSLSRSEEKKAFDLDIVVQKWVFQ